MKFLISTNVVICLDILAKMKNLVCSNQLCKTGAKYSNLQVHLAAHWLRSTVVEYYAKTHSEMHLNIHGDSVVTSSLPDLQYFSGFFLFEPKSSSIANPI